MAAVIFMLRQADGLMADAEVALALAVGGRAGVAPLSVRVEKRTDWFAGSHLV